jgi:hypothetical protein
MRRVPFCARGKRRFRTGASPTLAISPKIITSYEILDNRAGEEFYSGEMAIKLIGSDAMVTMMSERS